MNQDFSDYHVFIAGGLGEIGSRAALKIIEKGGLVSVLYSSDKNFKNAKNIQKLKVPILKVNYLKIENLKEVFINYSVENKINCLISTVGNGKTLSKFPFDDEEVKKLWEINFFANRNLAIAISEILKKYPKFNLNFSSSHILTSSVASHINVSAPIDYVTSKAALEFFVKSLAYLISPSQRINCISPGHIFTKDGTWGQNSIKKPEYVKKILNDKIPLNRFGTLDDISELFLFLLCNKSAYITGTNIFCDGGLKAKS